MVRGGGGMNKNQAFAFFGPVPKYIHYNDLKLRFITTI